MATLSPRARRHDDEIDLALHQRNAHHIVELVDAWGLARDQRGAREDDDVRLHFDGSDRTQARTVADVWATGGSGGDGVPSKTPFAA